MNEVSIARYSRLLFFFLFSFRSLKLLSAQLFVSHNTTTTTTKDTHTHNAIQVNSATLHFH